MIEIWRTNDPVVLSFLEALLRDGGVESVVLDTHASVLDGSSTFVERRLMTLEEDASRARRILAEAGYEPQ